mgnify:CR=1 FL=1
MNSGDRLPNTSEPARASAERQRVEAARAEFVPTCYRGENLEGDLFRAEENANTPNYFFRSGWANGNYLFTWRVDPEWKGYVKEYDMFVEQLEARRAYDEGRMQLDRIDAGPQSMPSQPSGKDSSSVQSSVHG